MKRSFFLASCALPFACQLGLFPVTAAQAQDLQTPPVAPPPPSAAPTASADQVQFSADSLDYEGSDDTVTATGDVRMYRDGKRLRADKVVWNRTSGKVVANGNVVVINPGGDTAYGDSVALTDSLKDGVIDNMLIVLERGGRLAARKGTRALDETVTMEDAAYTPCAVSSTAGCPKAPSWKITAVRVTYRPDRQRIYYKGARLDLFGLPGLPLPAFSNAVGGGNQSGLLAPDARYDRVNGFEIAQPYNVALGPNRSLIVTPRVFSAVAPMLQTEFSALTDLGAYRIGGYVTVSRQSDDLQTANPLSTDNALRGYVDGVAHFQLDPNWSISGSLRYASDKTFLRRYDISRDARLRSTASLERISPNAYFAITGWYVQTLRITETQGQQPIALPEIDWRYRVNDGILGGKISLQANSLAITRTEGQDTQRAFASAQWDLRKLTPWGQEVTFTAYGRGDVYHASDTQLTDIASYRGLDGWQARAIGALAVDVKWPFVGSFLSGSQRLTPRVQIVASPRIANLNIPNEDARAIDLDDTNLFSLNRFPGYDRFEDSSRVTYGLDWAIDLPGLSIATNIGQSYRLTERPSLFLDGTGLTDRFSDIVGRTDIRFHDFVSLTYRYRFDKDSLAVRRSEADATVGSRSTYVTVGYLRLNRDITPAIEDLQDRSEIRVGARAQVTRFWSVFGSTVVDLTGRTDDPLSVADGFSPVRHRLGFQYEDDCLRLGLTWKRDYRNTGDAQAGNSYLFTLAFKNLGR